MLFGRLFVLDFAGFLGAAVVEESVVCDHAAGDSDRETPTAAIRLSFAAALQFIIIY